MNDFIKILKPLKIEMIIKKTDNKTWVFDEKRSSLGTNRQTLIEGILSDAGIVCR